MKRHDEKTARLRELPLFASCDDRELSEIAKLVDEAIVPEGRVLIEEGSTSCSLSSEPVDSPARWA
jgi:hypothetical protein